MSATPIQIKPNDVFRFRWHMKEGDSHTDRYWCFDGQLIAKETPHGLILVDTYLSSGTDKAFTPTGAEQRGSLEFVCNLDDVVDVQHYDTQNYDEKDIFNLSRQHGCYKHYVRRKDAKRSKTAMLTVAYKMLNDAREAIKSKTFDIERVSRKIQEIEAGVDLEKVYL